MLKKIHLGLLMGLALGSSPLTAQESTDELDFLSSPEPAQAEPAPAATTEPTAAPASEPVPAATPVATVPVQTLATEPASAAKKSKRSAIEEIVVTATRREENIQDVVGGIQAISGAALDAKGAGGFQDYLTQVPGTGFRQDGSGNTKIGIRGISNISGNQIGAFSGSSPVGIYINDVPIAGSGQLPDLDLYDLNRVEVLKGPQGTLFGEGAMGGAIRMIVNEPNFEGRSLKGEISNSYTETGGYNQGYKLASNTPLSDTLGLRLVGSFKRNSGFVDLVNQNRPDANSGLAGSVRAISSWKLSDKLDAQVLYLKDISHQHAYPNVRPETESSYTSDIYERELLKSNIDLAGLTLKYAFDSVQVSSVSSLINGKRRAVFRLGLFKDLIQHNIEDRTGPAAFLAGFLVDTALLPSNYREEPYHNLTTDTGLAQELRFVSTGDSAFTWIGGLYYQQRKQKYVQTLYIYESPSPDGDNRQLFRQGQQPLRQYSAYGEGSYHFLNSFDLTLGLRGVRERIAIKDFLQSYGVLAAAQAAANDPNPKRLDVSTSYTKILPKISLGWHVNDDVLLYALVSRGYRTTTPNVQVNLGVGPPLLKADSVLNYEVGTKTQWLDGALVFNASAYYIDWKNLQATRTAQGRLGAVPINIIYVDNIGDASVKGVEAELQMAIGEGLSVGLTGAYQDGRLSGIDASSPAILNSRIPNSPEWTGALSLGYQHDAFGNYKWSANTSLQYVDEQGSREVTAKDPTGSKTASYQKLSAQLGLDSERWGLSLFGENLLGEVIELQNASLTDTEHFTTLGRPRTIGLRLRGNF